MSEFTWKDRQIIGKVFTSNNFGDFTVVDVVGKTKQGTKLYKCKFHDSGNEVNVRRSTIMIGSINDIWRFSDNGVPIERRCCRCHQFLSVDNFCRNVRQGYELNTICKQCVKVYHESRKSILIDVGCL
jgi:hypothetical protein